MKSLYELLRESQPHLLRMLESGDTELLKVCESIVAWTKTRGALEDQLWKDLESACERLKKDLTK